jgi:hypothetical protein|tara:strand:- start:102 stop:251 length:150 start_codon:yes stop_codon:yes gene_type:complete
MKEIIVVLVLVFGGSGLVLAYLGSGENRNIGFNNGQCSKSQQLCGVTWK